MKLLSTRIDENRVELTLASDPLIDVAEQLITVRMPRVSPDQRGLMWLQSEALQRAEKLIHDQIQRIEREMNQRPS